MAVLFCLNHGDNNIFLVLISVFCHKIVSLHIQ